MQLFGLCLLAVRMWKNVMEIYEIMSRIGRGEINVSLSSSNSNPEYSSNSNPEYFIKTIDSGQKEKLIHIIIELWILLLMIVLKKQTNPS